MNRLFFVVNILSCLSMNSYFRLSGFENLKEETVPTLIHNFMQPLI